MRPLRASQRIGDNRFMKRTCLVIIAVLSLKLLSPVDLHAQAAHTSSTANQERSASAPKQRRVKGQTLTSDVLPPIKIKFDKAFKYVGSQSFVLYNSAQVEQFFFVAADKGRIKRMFMV